MWSNVKNIFKVADLRNKVLFTLAMIAVYRFGTALRVPGVDAQAVSQLREASNSQGALGFLNLFSGGAFGSFSIFALGIMPYITASIIMQVLGVVIPKLEQWQQEGATGQRKITQWTRYLAIGIATLQGAHIYFRPRKWFSILGCGCNCSRCCVARSVHATCITRDSIIGCRNCNVDVVG
jgi:preprotein translocase subunit SecY